MNFEVKLLGINIQRDPKWDRNFSIMAFGDVGVEPLSMTLRGCALARLNGQLVAMPPKVPGAKPGDLGGIGWDCKGQFAQAVCERLIAGYKSLGGEMPPEPTKKQTNGRNAARRHAEKRDEAPIEYRTFPAKFELIEAETPEADEAEAVEGLHRTLSVEAEEVARVCG